MTPSAGGGRRRFVEEPITGHEWHRHQVLRVLREGRTAVQSYGVMDLGGYGLAMVIDGRIQSTEADECAYHEALILPAYALSRDARRVLCLGGANGGVLHRLCALREVEAVVQVDVDPELFEVSKALLPHMHLGGYEDPRCQILFGNPRELLDTLDGQFDLVLADLPDAVPGTHVPSLFTREFYASLRRLMADTGLFVTQAGPANPHACTLFASVLRTLGECFRFVTPYSISVPSYGIPWGFAVAGDAIDPSTWEAAEVGRRLERLPGGLLRAYDVETHRHMFSLPRQLREALARQGRVITDERPIRAVT